MFPCDLQEHPSRPTLTIRFRAPVQELPQHFGRIYQTIIQYLEELGEEHAGPAFAIYYNTDMQNLDIEAGFPVSQSLPARGEVQASEIPGGRFAVCHYIGVYAQIGPAYDQLLKFANDMGYAPTGAAYEWYLNGPDEVPPEKLKTDLMFPVTRIEEAEAI